jgi:hypothetical protein
MSTEQGNVSFQINPQGNVAWIHNVVFRKKKQLATDKNHDDLNNF